MGVILGTEGKHKAEPNVVPMIDIMLVLLIIFMIVTPILAAGFQAQMPMGKNMQSTPEEKEDVVLGIDRNGKYFLDPVKLPNGEVRTGEIGPVCFSANCNQTRRLEERLREIYAQRTIDRILYFKADQNLEFGVVQDALEIARRAGVRVLAAITEPKRDYAVLGQKEGN